MALIITLVAGFLGGCGHGPDDEYRYGVKQEQVDFEEEAREMTDVCGLNLQDIAMIDIVHGSFPAQATGLTCPKIRDLLASYHTQGVIQPEAMLHNPALTGNLPTTTGIRYAVISTDRQTYPPDTPKTPDEMLVDLDSGTAAYGDQYYLANSLSGTSHPLTSDQTSTFLNALTPLTTWGDPWTDTATSDVNLSYWEIAVIASDWQLYRWGGWWTNPRSRFDPIPVGLTDVYDAFWNLVP